MHLQSRVAGRVFGLPAGTHGVPMLHYALMFLIVGLIAGALGLGGVAAIAGQISWLLFLIGIVLLLVHIIRGRRPPLDL